MLTQTIPGLEYHDGRNYGYTGSFGGLVFDGQSIWAANVEGTKITQIKDGKSKHFEVGAITTYGAYDGLRFIWFTSSRNNLVLLVDKNSGIIAKQLPSEGFPLHLAFDGQFMWVGNRIASTVSIIDRDTFNTETLALFNDAKNPVNPTSLVFDGKYMWIGGEENGNEGAGNLLLVDIKTKSIQEAPIKKIPVPNNLAFDGSHVWGIGPKQIFKLDVVSFGESRKVTQNNQHSLLFDGSHMWTIEGNFNESGNLEKIDASTFTTLGKMFIPEYHASGVFDGFHLWFSAKQNESKGILKKYLVG